MNNALQAYNVMAFPTSDTTPQRSCRLRCESHLNIFQEMHCYWNRPTQDQLSGHCAMCCIGQNQPWVCQALHE